MDVSVQPNVNFWKHSTVIIFCMRAAKLNLDAILKHKSCGLIYKVRWLNMLIYVIKSMRENNNCLTFEKKQTDE